MAIDSRLLDAEAPDRDVVLRLKSKKIGNDPKRSHLWRPLPDENLAIGNSDSIFPSLSPEKDPPSPELDQTGSNGINSGISAEFKRDQTGSNDYLNGINTLLKRDHEASQTGSTPSLNGIKDDLNGINKRDQTGSNKISEEKIEVRDKNSSKIEDISTQTGSNGIKNQVKNDLDPVLSSSRSRLNEALIPFKESVDPVLICVDPVKNEVDPICLQTRSHLQTGSTNGIKRDQKLNFPTAEQMKLVLAWLIEKQENSGLGYTPRIQRSEIASDLGISLHMVKIQLTRLCDLGMIERREWRLGRGPSGTIFHIRHEVVLAFKRDQQTGSNGINKRDQQTGSESPVVSSSLIKSTTTTVPNFLNKEITERARRPGFVKYDIGANELKIQWSLHSSKFRDEEAFLLSVDHVEFVLATTGMPGRNPKGVALAVFGKGDYLEPSNYRSWEERLLDIKEQRAQEKLKALKEGNERLAKHEEEIAEEEFKLWLRNLTSAEKLELLKGNPIFDSYGPKERDERLHGVAASSFLRAKYFERNGTNQ